VGRGHTGALMGCEGVLRWGIGQKSGKRSRKKKSERVQKGLGKEEGPGTAIVYLFRKVPRTEVNTVGGLQLGVGGWGGG